MMKNEHFAAEEAIFAVFAKKLAEYGYALGYEGLPCGCEGGMLPAVFRRERTLARLAGYLGGRIRTEGLFSVRLYVDDTDGATRQGAAAALWALADLASSGDWALDGEEDRLSDLLSMFTPDSAPSRLRYDGEGSVWEMRFRYRLHPKPSEKERLRLCLRLGTSQIEIGTEDSPYRLLEGGVEGLDSPDFAASVREKAYLDGGVLTPTRIPSRRITLRFEIANGTEQERLRRELIAFFSPTEDGVLSVTRFGVTRHIGCRLAEGVAFTQKTLCDPIEVRVPLICPSPYFYGEEERAALQAGAVGMLSFPLTVTKEGGITASVTGGDHMLSADNKGDSAAGFCLTLSVEDSEEYADDACEMAGITVSRRGAAGDVIALKTSLKKGDVLELSTVPGAKYVRKNGALCMDFDRESRFFALGRGISTLAFAFETLHGTPKATLTFRPTYHGV